MSAYELRILNESTGQYIPLAFVQGADGKDTFTEAKAKGYTGTEDEFYSVLANAQGALDELMNWSGQHAMDSSIHTTAEEKATWDGKADKASVYAVVLTLAGWSATNPIGDTYSANYFQTVDVNGVLSGQSGQMIHVSPDTTSRQECENAGVRCVANADGQLIFATDSMPSSELIVNVLIQEAAT